MKQNGVVKQQIPFMIAKMKVIGGNIVAHGRTKNVFPMMKVLFKIKFFYNPKISFKLVINDCVDKI